MTPNMLIVLLIRTTGVKLSFLEQWVLVVDLRVEGRDPRGVNSEALCGGGDRLEPAWSGRPPASASGKGPEGGS